jgi:hypothetical protein
MKKKDGRIAQQLLETANLSAAEAKALRELDR